MAKIRFNKENNTWYRILPDGTKEALGNNSLVSVYDTALKKRVYRTLGANGSMGNATELLYNDFRSKTNPTSIWDAVKSSYISNVKNTAIEMASNPATSPLWFLGLVGKSLYNNYHEATKTPFNLTLADINKEKDEAERRDKESQDKKEFENSFLTGYYNVLNNGLDALTDSEKKAFASKYGDKNSKFLLLGYSDLDIYSTRVFNTLFGSHAAKKLYKGTLVEDLNNWKLLKLARELLELGDPSLLLDIDLKIGLLLAHQYKDLLTRYNFEPKDRSHNVNTGLEGNLAKYRTSGKKSVKDKNEIEGAPLTHTVLNAVEYGKEWLLSGIGELFGGGYKNDQRDRVLSMMNGAMLNYSDTSYAYNTEELKKKDSSMADFYFSLGYNNYKSHIARIGYDEDEESKLREFYKYLWASNALGMNTANEWLSKDLNKIDADRLSFNPLSSISRNAYLNYAGSIINGTVDTFGGLGNWIAHFNPATLTATSIADVVDWASNGLYGWTFTDLYKHSVDNAFANWAADAKTYGTVWGLDEYKNGRTYTNEELALFLKNGVIDYKQYSKAVKDNADIAAGKKSINDASLVYGKGANSAYGSTPYDPEGWVIANLSTIPEVINVSLMMTGTSSLGMITKGIGTSMAKYALTMQRISKAATLGLKISTRAANATRKTIGKIGAITADMSPTISALALDHGYAKSAYDLNMLTAESFLLSKEYKNKELEYINSLMSAENPNGLENWYNNNLEYIKLIKENNPQLVQLIKDIYNRRDLSDYEKKRLSIILTVKLSLKDNYLKEAEHSALAASAITYALTGFVDVGTFNTLSKGLYGVGATKLSGIANTADKIVNKFNPLSYIKSASPFIILLTKNGIKVSATPAGRAYLLKKEGATALQSFISNYNLDLGVGAGTEVYNTMMDNYIDNHFSALNIKDLMGTINDLSLGSEFTMATLGAADASIKGTSIRDGLYGGFAGLFFGVRFMGKGLKAEIRKANPNMGRIAKAKDAVPFLHFDTPLIDVALNSNNETKAVNLARLLAAKSVEVFLNSEEGKAFKDNIFELNKWNNELRASIAKGDITKALNDLGHALLTSAFIVNSLKNTIYGLSVIAKVKQMAEREDVTEELIENLKRRLLDGEELSEEETVLASDLLKIADLNNISESKDIAEYLNTARDNAKDYLLMIKDVDKYTKLILAETSYDENYVLNLAYAETLAFNEYIKRRIQEKKNKYQNTLNIARTNIEKEDKDNTDNVESNIKANNAGVLRLIHLTLSLIDKAVLSAETNLEEANKQEAIAKKAYELALKEYNNAVLKVKNTDNKIPNDVISNLLMLGMLYFMALNSVDYCYDALKKAKKALDISEVEHTKYKLKEDYSREVDRIEIEPFIMSAKDLLKLGYEDLITLLQNYDKLSKDLQKELDRVALEFTGIKDNAKLARLLFLLLTDGIRIDTEHLKKIQNEIDNASRDLDRFKLRVNDLAINQAEIFYKLQFIEFASQDYSDYSDFKAAYDNKIKELKLEEDGDSKIIGLNSALKDNQYYKQLKLNAKESLTLTAYISTLDVANPDILKYFAAVLNYSSIEKGKSFGLVNTKDIKSIENVTNTIEDLINNISDLDIKDALSLTNLLLDMSDGLIKVLKEDFLPILALLKERLKEYREIEEARNKDTSTGNDNALDENKKKIKEHLLKDYELKDLKKFLSESLGIDSSEAKALSKDKEASLKIKEIIEKALKGETVSNLDEIYLIIANKLYTLLGLKLPSTSNTDTTSPTTSTSLSKKGINFGNLTSPEGTTSREIAEVCKLYLVNEYLTGTKIPINDINLDKIPIRILNGKIGGINLKIGDYYAIAVELNTIAISEQSEKDSSYGKSIIIKGKGYLILGFIDGRDIVDSEENPDEAHIVCALNDTTNPLRVATTIRYDYHEDDKITPIKPTNTLTGIHFTFEKGLDDKPVITYKKGGAVTLESERNMNERVFFTEIGDTENKEGKKLGDKEHPENEVENPLEFNSRTKLFTEALKHFIELFRRTKFEGNLITELNKYNKDSSLTNKSNESDQGKDFYSTKSEVKSKLANSLVKSIYLANGWHYEMVLLKDNVFGLAIKNAEENDKAIIHILATASLEDFADETKLNQFINQALQSIGRNESIITYNGYVSSEEDNSIRKELSSDANSICKWECSWSNFDLKSDDPKWLHDRKVNNVNLWIEEGLLLSRKKTATVREGASEVIISSDKEKAAKEAHKKTELFLKESKDKSDAALKEISMGEPEVADKADTITQVRDRNKNAISKVIDAVKEYYKAITSTARGSRYELYQSYLKSWFGIGNNSHINMLYYRPLERKSKAELESENKNCVPLIIGTGTDLFLRDAFEGFKASSDGASSGRLFKGKDYNFEKYSALFTKEECDTLRDKVLKYLDDNILYTEENGVRTLRNIEVLASNVLVGSDIDYHRELDLVLFNKDNGEVYIIDFKTFNEDSVINEVSEEYRNNKGYITKHYHLNAKDPNGISYREKYAMELILQRRWAELMLANKGINVPRILSFLMYIPVSRKNNNVDIFHLSIVSVTVNEGGLESKFYTLKISRGLGSRGKNIFATKEGIHILTDTEGFAKYEDLAFDHVDTRTNEYGMMGMKLLRERSARVLDSPQIDKDFTKLMDNYESPNNTKNLLNAKAPSESMAEIKAAEEEQQLLLKQMKEREIKTNLDSINLVAENIKNQDNIDTIKLTINSLKDAIKDAEAISLDSARITTAKSNLRALETKLATLESKLTPLEPVKGITINLGGEHVLENYDASNYLELPIAVAKDNTIFIPNIKALQENTDMLNELHSLGYISDGAYQLIKSLGENAKLTTGLVDEKGNAVKAIDCLDKLPPKESRHRERGRGRSTVGVVDSALRKGAGISLISFILTQGGDLFNLMGDTLLDLALHCF